MEKSNHKRIIKKIVILGAESTGKSTLCRDLAIHYNTVFVPEYARSYFETHDINTYTPLDLEKIAHKQIELENTLYEKANNLLICDTSLITIKIWSKNEFNYVPSFIVNSIKSDDYDLYLLCNNDTPWTEDTQRKHPHLRQQVLEWNKQELIKLNVPFVIIRGLKQQRLTTTIKLIDSFFGK